MSNDTKFRLTTALLTHGHARLCEVLKLSTSEVSRKINGEAGWTIDQLAIALDAVSALVVPAQEDCIVLPKQEYQALRVLARQALDGRGED